jgi:hypothetical protein
MKNNLTFLPIFCQFLQSKLSDSGCNISEQSHQIIPESKTRDKAYSWASATRNELIRLDPQLLSSQYFWSLLPGKNGNIHFSCFNEDGGRLTNKFNLKVVQNSMPIKSKTIRLDAPENLSHEIPGFIDGLAWIRDSWNAEIKKGKSEIDQIDPTLIRSWEQTILAPISNHLSVCDNISKNTFLDFCLGQDDTYWLFKKPRFDLLSITPMSRNSRLKNGVHNATPLSINGDPCLITEHNHILCRINLSDGMSIDLNVAFQKVTGGIAVKFLVFFNSNWVPEITKTFEFY